MSKKHTYRTATTWTGNLGEGTSSYTAYLRNFTVSAEGKPDLHGSADPAFRGDAGRWNPEEMLLAAVSACHKLWYLHLCADAALCVTAYTDHAEAVMDEGSGGNAGRFVSAVLKPRVTIAAGSDRAKALELHHEAHRLAVSSPIRSTFRLNAALRLRAKRSSENRVSVWDARIVKFK